MTDEAWARPFADVIRDLRRGDAHDELSERLAELVAAVEAHGKPGRLVLTIVVEPYKGTDALAVRDQIKTVIPEADRDATLMFAEDGRLTRHNPRQPEIPGLRDVSATHPATEKPEEALS
ncbi:MAG: hypothetical protein M3N32_07900 [Actinomycetota bacterium]|nr:hypothetical protein [Actinomycetota bacterium]